jgi:hypothetical protein
MFVTEKAHNIVGIRFHGSISSNIYNVYIYIHSEAPNLHFIVQL